MMPVQHLTPEHSGKSSDPPSQQLLKLRAAEEGLSRQSSAAGSLSTLRTQKHCFFCLFVFHHTSADIQSLQEMHFQITQMQSWGKWNYSA